VSHRDILAAAMLVCWACFASGQERCTLTVGRHSVRTLSFSGNDGKLLAVGTTDLSVWDWANEKRLWRVEGFGNAVTRVCFSTDCKQVVTVYTALGEVLMSVVQHWDMENGAEKKKTELVGGGANRALSRHGKVLLTVSGFPNKVTKAWIVQDGEYVALEGHTDHVATGAVTADGKLAATASLDGTVRLWDLPAGKERWRVKFDDPIGDYLAFSPDGKTLATQTHRKRIIRLFDTDKGNEKEKLPSSCNPALPMIYSPDGKFLTFCGRGGICLWDVDRNREFVTLPFPKKGESAKIEALAFSPDSKVLAIGGNINGQGAVRLYDVPRIER
jgi:hypothetical protein